MDQSHSKAKKTPLNFRGASDSYRNASGGRGSISVACAVDDLKGSLKSQLGIDLDMPVDKDQAVKQMVNYDGAIKKN
jgi:hypothetical protein